MEINSNTKCSEFSSRRNGLDREVQRKKKELEVRCVHDRDCRGKGIMRLTLLPRVISKFE